MNHYIKFIPLLKNELATGDWEVKTSVVKFEKVFFCNINLLLVKYFSYVLEEVFISVFCSYISILKNHLNIIFKR